MIALFDINVILDVLLARKDFLTDSAASMSVVEKGKCRGLLCAGSITTIHYIVRKQLGSADSLLRISDLLSIFEIALVNRAVIDSAIKLSFADFEDAVIHESATQGGATCIVTRNLSDFKRATLLVYSPSQFLAALRE